MSFEIISTKSYLPNTKITNQDISKIVDTTDEWIYQRTGIKNRYYAKGQTLYQMVEKCVDKFDSKDLENVDVILCTSMSNKNLAPTLSTHIANHLKIEDVLCLDLNAACSSFVYALSTAQAYLSSKMYKKVLIVSAEKMSNILDFEDRKTIILFGDGIGAAIMQNKIDIDKPIFHIKTLKTKDELYINEDGHLKMLGQDVFKFAYKAIVDCLEYTLDQKNLKIEDIDYFMFHQANMRIIDKIKKKYNILDEKVLVNIEDVANTSSASIPILLANNQIDKNKSVFMCGFGAGLSYGSVLYKS